MLRGLSLLARSATEAPLFRQRLCGPTFLRYFSEGASGASDDGGDGEDNGSPKRGGGGRGTGRKDSSRKRREEGRGKRPADDEEAGEKPKGDVLTSGEGGDRPGEGVGPDGGLPRHSSALVTQAIPETYPQLLALPVAKRPIFPHGVHQLHLTDAKVIEAIKLLSKTGQGYLGTFLTKDDANEADTITDLSQIYRVGSFSSILRIDGYENGASVIINSHRRIRAESLIKTDPYAMVQVHNVKDEPYSKDNVVIQAFTQEIIATVRDIARISGFFRENFAHAQYSQSLVTRSLLEDPALLADFVTNLTSASSSDKQEVLESLVIEERLRKALILLKKELLSAKIQSEISKDVEKKMSARQREYFLQEQLKSIKKELGIEKEDKETLVSKFRELASKKMMPEAVKKVFDEELNKLSHLEGSSSEFNVTRNYLDWLSQLPWGITSQENLDILHASKVLDEDHYGLKDVKERILEFIAVGKLRGTVHGKILCLVGPPGVGKTSIGKSIARTLDRKFFRFSVGGLSDVAEIKGHRRTYVGAMPGKMIQCLKKTQTENPLVLIDEIDKIGRGHNGDPSSALLEMLDPEQNASFLDHYLDVSVDLSKVLFVCTANTLDTIPGPLLDRMEVIRLSGYIEEEKVEISKKYLIPLTLQSTGLNESQIQLSVEAIRSLIHLYCRESGVRNLQKHIDKIYRKAAFRLVKDPSLKSVEITKDNLPDFVGNPIFTSDRTYAINPIGVVCGLAWTSLGGSMLYVESAVDMGAPSGKSSFFRTGQLGEVMNESAAIAYTFAKAFVKSQDPGNDFFEKHSVHLHVPDGATKKDGPSAGVTMASSLISLALKTPPSNDVAMTGELTLTGKVLRIGGVKEKVIAAKRSGIKTILLPISNQADWKELEDHIKEGLQVHFVDYYKDIFPILFPDFQPSPPAPSPLAPPPPQPLPASSPGPAMGTPGPRDQPLAQ